MQLQIKHRRAKGYAILALAVVATAYGWWRAARETAILRADYAVVRALVDGTDYPMTVVESNGRIWLWNPAMELLTGYSEREMVGGTLERVMDHETWVNHDSAFAKAMKSRDAGVATRVKCNVTAKNGDEIPVEITVRLLQLGKRLYVTATVLRLDKIVEISGDQQ